MRIYLANVGSNSSHRVFSPIFDNGAFEFLPIPEEHIGGAACAVRYCDLRAHSDPDCNLRPYVPPNLWNSPCHNDPEFATLTYGDNGDNPRSVDLTNMRQGDALLFLARLESYSDGKRTGQAGFYLIGGLRAEYAGWITPQSPRLERFARNSHAIRGDARFWGVAGSPQSRRFRRAVPANREICAAVFRDRQGNPWTWDNGQTELARIGSYTRACRRVLDTADSEQRQRTAALRAWIARHSSPQDAELLNDDTS